MKSYGGRGGGSYRTRRKEETLRHPSINSPKYEQAFSTDGRVSFNYRQKFFGFFFFGDFRSKANLVQLQIRAKCIKQKQVKTLYLVADRC